jgi:branched-chain amino acid transport system permease protein
MPVGRRYGPYVQAGAWVVGVAGLLVLPNVASEYITNLCILIFLFAALNQAWNILGGFAGQMSLGHAAFFGVGAYTSTLLFARLRITPWLGLLAGAAMAALLGLFIGYLAFRYRIRGVYFVLITLAFGESLRIIDSNWSVTGGASGLLLPSVRGDNWFAMEFVNIEPYYYLALALAILHTAIVFIVSRSTLGLYFTAIRGDEEAAAALGVNTLKYKLIAMVFSAAMTAVCGTFQAQYIKYIDPAITFSIDVSIQALLSAVVGGMGTIVGPLLGSLLLTPLSQIVEQLIGNRSGLQAALYGVLLVAITLAAPRGVWPLLRDQVRRHWPPRRAGAPSDLDTVRPYPPRLREEPRP